MDFERELVIGCQKFDQRSQKRVYEKYASLMRGICYRYCKDQDEVQDIMQEGFLKIFIKINQYTGNGSFEGWMKRVMVNTAIEYYRNKKKSITVSMEDLSILDAKEVEDDSFMELVETEILLNAIQTVQQEYRLVLNMYYIDDFSHKEIAQQLAIDEATSRKRLQRAKLMVKEKCKMYLDHQKSW